MSTILSLLMVPIGLAAETTSSFVDRLVTTHDYSLSPSGRYLLVKERSNISDGYAAISTRRLTEPGAPSASPELTLPFDNASWFPRRDRDELFGLYRGQLYRYDLTGGHGYRKIELPPNLAKINIRYLPRTDNDHLVFSATDKQSGARSIYHCRFGERTETTCASTAEYSARTEEYALDHEGDVVARFQWSQNDPQQAHFQVRDSASRDRWRSTWSFNSAETRFNLQTRPDAFGRVYALSNRDRDTVALVRFDIHSGSEVVIAQHDHDIDEVFTNDHTFQLLATFGYPGLQAVQYHMPSLKRAVDNLMTETEATTRLDILSADQENRRFVVRLWNARVGYRTVLLHQDGTHETLDQSPNEAGHGTPYLPPQPILMNGRIEGPPLRGLLTRPRGEPGPFPFVIMIHGGPRSQYRWRIHPLVQRLSSLGIAVLQLNYRGSSGHGREYESFMSRRHQPFASVRQDVELAHDWLIRNGMGEAGRAGLFGESFGATVAVLAAADKPDSYPAVALLGGLFDFTEYVHVAKEKFDAGQQGGLAQWVRYMGVPGGVEPSAQFEALLSRRADINPCRLAANLRSSVLIFAGKRDRIAHPEQSVALHKELRARGISSRLKLLDQGHGLTSRRHLVTVMSDAASFLHRILNRGAATEAVDVPLAETAPTTSRCLASTLPDAADPSIEAE